MASEASAQFWNAFQVGGGNTSVCRCGRYHYATGPGSYLGEDEREELDENRDSEPERYIAHDRDSSVCFTSLQGGIVYGCPCGAASRVEAFLIANRDDILKFYKLRLEAERFALREGDAAMEALQAQ